MSDPERSAERHVPRRHEFIRFRYGLDYVGDVCCRRRLDVCRGLSREDKEENCVGRWRADVALWGTSLGFLHALVVRPLPIHRAALDFD